VKSSSNLIGSQNFSQDIYSAVSFK